MSNNTSQPIRAIAFPIMLFDGGTLDNLEGTTAVTAAAAILLTPKGKRYTVSQFLSFATLEEAEYTGLIIGLRKAQTLGIRQLEIKGDSEVVFNQVNGLTKVTPEKLRSLYQEAQKLMQSFEQVTLEWIPSKQNRSAIAAVNRCLEEALGGETKPTTSLLASSAAVNHLIQLGDRATPEDYQQLTASLDELTFKPLAELKILIPHRITQAIAQQENQGERDLAEIYRWYLRGLPLDMSVRKVKNDQELEGKLIEQLPLEPQIQRLEISPLANQGVSDPFGAKVTNIIKMIETLSQEEKTQLVQELVQLPDLVNLFLKAITDNTDNMSRK